MIVSGSDAKKRYLVDGPSVGMAQPGMALVDLNADRVKDLVVAKRGSAETVKLEAFSGAGGGRLWEKNLSEDGYLLQGNGFGGLLDTLPDLNGDGAGELLFSWPQEVAVKCTGQLEVRSGLDGGVLLTLKPGCVRGDKQQNVNAGRKDDEISLIKWFSILGDLDRDGSQIFLTGVHLSRAKTDLPDKMTLLAFKIRPGK